MGKANKKYQEDRLIRNKRIIKPLRLRPGDRIGIVAPAGPVNKAELEAGLKLLADSGFRPELSSNVYSRIDYLAGEDDKRLSDLHAMFLDDEIRAIFCARGGYGSLRIIDGIKYDLIEKHPKILVGYSDITALLIAVYEKTGLITFHGPMVRDFSSNSNTNWQSLCGLVSENLKPAISLDEGSVLTHGKAEGILKGGNLSLMCHLAGTPFFPRLDGCILFLEDKGEPLYRIDRMLTHLRLTGELDGLSGFVAGDFLDCDSRVALERLLKDVLGDLGIPLATGLAVGHGAKNLALPFGVRAELDTDLMTLEIKEKSLKD